MENLNSKIKSGFNEFCALIIVIPTICVGVIRDIVRAFRDHFKETYQKRESKEKFDLSDLDNRTRHEC